MGGGVSTGVWRPTVPRTAGWASVATGLLQPSGSSWSGGEMTVQPAAGERHSQCPLGPGTSTVLGVWDQEAGGVSPG